MPLTFTHLYEVDEHTESVDSVRENAVAEKIRCYYAEQQKQLGICRRDGGRGQKKKR